MRNRVHRAVVRFCILQVQFLHPGVLPMQVKWEGFEDMVQLHKIGVHCNRSQKGRLDAEMSRYAYNE